MTDYKLVYDHLIIGSGIAGLTLANLLARNGDSVLVLEKNDHVGGRASYFETDGYFFDMGPSWFMQLDVWEQTFKLFDVDIHNELNLVPLDPAYRVFDAGSDREFIDVPSGDLNRIYELFEELEPGSSNKLKTWLEEAKEKYQLGYDLFMYRNYQGLGDFFNRDLVNRGKNLGNLSDLVKSVHSVVKREFNSPELIKILEYVLIFIGSDPKNTPALYTLMNHIDFAGGVYYPQGGYYELIKLYKKIGESYGAKYLVNSEVGEILIKNHQATGVRLINGEVIQAKNVISNADITWTDQQLLPKKYQQYSDKYWDKRVYAPSAFLIYLGIDGDVPELIHHNFRFQKDWEKGFSEIFTERIWPEDPSFYVCVTSKTDPDVAPPGKENLYILCPVAPGLSMTPEFKEEFKDRIYQLIEAEMGIENFKKRIEFERVFTYSDFKARYHAPQGTGLGLAHTMMQSTVFRPNNVHKNISNLYFCGAGTNPGIGTSIAAISGQNAYKRIRNINHPRPLKVSDLVNR
jgi:phytoene desaturase